MLKKEQTTNIYYDGRKVHIDAKGYPCVWFRNRRKRVHIVEWEKHNGSKPKKHDVHHVDMDKMNWNISNLQLLNKYDHQKTHAGWIKTNGEWSHKPCNNCKRILPLSEFYKRKGMTPTALCKKCHCIETAKRQADPANIDKVRARKALWVRNKRKAEKCVN